MLKIYILLICVSFSLIHAQLTIKPEVFLQAETSLRKYMDEGTPSCFVYEITGKEKIPMKVNVPVDEVAGRYVVLMNSRSKTERIYSQNENKLRSIALEDIKKYFVDEVSDSYKITRVGFEYEQKNEKIDIVGAFVMFHQLVEGLPVRGDAFIYMYYDAFSNIKKIEYSWLRTEKKVLSENECYVDDVSQHRNRLMQKVVEVNEDMERENVRGVLYDAILSWRMVSNDTGNNILIPSVIYLGHFDDLGITRYLSFDIVLFSKSLGDF